jgi:hypothetical protein
MSKRNIRRRVINNKRVTVFLPFTLFSYLIYRLSSFGNNPAAPVSSFQNTSSSSGNAGFIPVPVNKPLPPSASGTGARRLTPSQINEIAKRITRRYFPQITPVMLTSMAWTESSGITNAYRREPDGRASYGLMQTLYSTARWLYDSMGYRAYPLETPESLYNPEISMYFEIV